MSKDTNKVLQSNSKKSLNGITQLKPDVSADSANNANGSQGSQSNDTQVESENEPQQG